MKDRQPTQVLANGAIRYGIYSADGTLDHYEYMKREDAPTVDGTPLNKANLLSNETEDKIWHNKTKPEEPTVNDALYELSKGTARIGDIAMTARGDRSSAWLPCDGRAISNTEYPDLYNALRTDVDAGDWNEIPVTGLTGRYASLSYANGHWFCLAESDYTIKIATSDDLASFSVASKLVTGVYSLVVGLSRVHYYDGRYIFAYYTTSGTKDDIKILYATSPTGPWTIVDAEKVDVIRNSGTSNCEPGDILIYNGVYYVTYPVNNSTSVTSQKRGYIYSTSLTGTWTAVVMDKFYSSPFVQDASDYGLIYAYRNGLKSFSGLNTDGTSLQASLTDPEIDLAVSGDKIVSIDTTTVTYSLDGGDTLSGTTALGTSYDASARHTAAYDGNILAFLLTDGTNHYIAVMSALDVAPKLIATAYDIANFAINGDLVAGVVKTSTDAQVTILKRDFSFSAKRIPRITPDGRSYAYIKALEE